jgi:ribosomal 50S subunit-associated protein YjgA (DUF615 family)
MNATAVDRQTFQRVVQLLQEYRELDVDRLRQLVEHGRKSRRSSAEPKRPKSASELLALVETGVLSSAEAGRYLRLLGGKTRRPRVAS